MDMHGVQVTWLGHGTFRIRDAGGKTLLLDPWLQDNPACPDNEKRQGKLDAMLISHGHVDHIGNAITTAQESRPDAIISNVEIGGWLGGKGIEKTIGMNKGGAYDLGWVKVTLTHADHSSSIQDGDQTLYGGEPVGFVLAFPGGFTLYAAGDTTVFSDMSLIRELYHPSVAILPIGDFYTMGPSQAAYAAKLLGVSAVIPAHYGTFPALTGTPAALRQELDTLGLNAVEVAELKPGQTLS